MIYRFLGNTGIQVSAIGFGNMVSAKVTPEVEEACLKTMQMYFFDIITSQKVLLIMVSISLILRNFMDLDKLKLYWEIA